MVCPEGCREPFALNCGVSWMVDGEFWLVKASIWAGWWSVLYDGWFDRNGGWIQGPLASPFQIERARREQTKPRFHLVSIIILHPLKFLVHVSFLYKRQILSHKSHCIL